MAAVASPFHLTLTANVVSEVELNQDFTGLEVLNVDGAAAVYFRIGSTDPTIGGAGTFVLPAAINSLEVPVFTSGNTTVRLISAGTPKVSVRGL